MKYNKPPTTMKCTRRVKSSLVAIRKTLLILSRQDNKQVMKNNFESKKTVSHNCDGLSTSDLTKEIFSYPKEPLIAKGDSYSDENKPLLQDSIDKIYPPDVKTEFMFTFKPNMWSKKVSQGEIGLVQKYVNKSLVTSTEEQHLCSAINLNLLEVTTNCDTRRDMSTNRKKRLNSRKFYNPNNSSYLQTLLESDLNVESSITSENVVHSGPTVGASKMLTNPANDLKNVEQSEQNILSAASSSPGPSFARLVVTAVIEQLPVERNKRSKPTQETKVVTKKKASKKIKPIDFDAIEIFKLPNKGTCVSNQKNGRVNKSHSKNYYPDIVRQDAYDAGFESSYSNKQKNKSSKPTQKTKKNLKVITKKNASRKGAPINHVPTKMNKLPAKKANVTNQRNRISKVSSNKRYSKNHYSDIVMRQQANDDYESLYSDDQLCVTKKTTKGKKNTSITSITNESKLKHVRIKPISFKPMFESKEQPQSSSSSPLPELEIELTTPPRPAVVEFLSDSDSFLKGSFPEPVKDSPKMKLLCNISLAKQLENKNMNDECVVSNNSAIAKMPTNFSNQAVVQRTHRDQDLEGFHKLQGFAEMDVENDLTILKPNDVTAKNKNDDDACTYLLSSQISLPDVNIEHSNEPIMSWIATGLPNDSTEAFKRIAEAVLSGYADIIKAYLQSLTGPVHPSLKNAYDILIKHDQDLNSYLKKK